MYMAMLFRSQPYEPQRQNCRAPARQSACKSSGEARIARKPWGLTKLTWCFFRLQQYLMLVVCVQYVQLQCKSLQTAPKNVQHLQEELANLNEANTTKYNSVMDSVNLEEVREKAMDDLGMVYANAESGGRIR